MGLGFLKYKRIISPSAGGSGGGGTINGSGTVNYIAKFTPGTTDIGDSQFFDNGTLVGLGVATGLVAKLGIISTTEQLRLGYNDVNYFSTTISSVGLTQFDAVGSGAGFIFADKVGIGTVSSVLSILNVQSGAAEDFITIGQTGTIKAYLGYTNTGGGNLVLVNGPTVVSLNYDFYSYDFINTGRNLSIGYNGDLSARLGILSTTEQLRIAYDTSNYYSTTVSSAGLTQFDAVGSGAGFQFLEQIYNFGTGDVPTNTAFGFGALIGANTGTSGGNTVLGYQSGTANITGFDNTFIGYNTGLTNTTQQGNTVVGSTAFSNTSGANTVYNTVIGHAAGVNLQNRYNVLVGYNAGNAQTSADENTLIGNFSGYQIISGYWNVGLGSNTLHSNITGLQNTAIGSNAGYSTTGSNGVFLGNKAGYYETAGNSLYIHNGLGVTDLATEKSNSLIYGVFDASVANQRLTINASLIVGSAALSTTATDGFLYIPTCAGTPTGTPTTQTGTVPLVWDSTNKKFYIYDGANWIGGTNPGVFS